MKRPLLYFLCCVLWLLATRPPMAQSANQNPHPLTSAVIADSKRPDIDEVSITGTDQALADDSLTYQAVTPGITPSPVILFHANSAIHYSRILTKSMLCI